MYVGSALVHKHITENNWHLEVHVILARTDKIEKIICLVGRFRTQRFMDNFNVVFFPKHPNDLFTHFEFLVHFFFGRQTNRKKCINGFYSIVKT